MDRVFGFSGRAIGRAGSWVGLLCLSTLVSEAWGRPGTHPASISTFDTRASSVVFAYRRGSQTEGGFNQVSYNANFTNTTGVLSSQFGVHYVNFKGASDEPVAHGVAGGAVALFNIPITRRWDNGLPIAGFGPFVGVVPTALVSGQQNFLSLPLVIGLSVPISPAKALTITPWYELAFSIDLDSVVKPAEFESFDPCSYTPCDPTTGQPLPIDPTMPGSQVIETEAVSDILARGVEIDFSMNVPMRLGLDLALHLGDSVDLAAHAGFSSLGSAFSGTAVAIFGGSLTWRWDAIVPAVLPPEKRLLRESCEDIEARFRTCPASRRWRTPEEQGAAPATGAPAKNQGASDPAAVPPPGPPAAPSSAGPPLPVPPPAAPPPPAAEPPAGSAPATEPPASAPPTTRFPE